MSKELRKILVIRFSSLGDIVLTTPVIEALKTKFPQSQIFFLTKTQYGDALRNDPRIFSLIEFDPMEKHRGFHGFMRLISFLRSCDFELLVDLHANPRSFLIRHLTQSKIKLKYDKRLLSRLMMVYFKFLKIKPIHTIDSYLEALKKIQIHAPSKTPMIFLNPDDVAFVEHFLLEEKVKKDDIVIGVHPGARWEAKRWDEEKFRQVCQTLIRKHRCRIILFGDTGDEKVIERTSEDITDAKLIKALGWSLGRFMSLLKRCDCLVTNDSGPMHIAQALQVPMVAIFGPTHPKLGFAPKGSKNVVLCADVKCSPCSLHGKRKCHKKSRLCMDLIQPEMVVEAVESLLKDKKSNVKEI